MKGLGRRMRMSIEQKERMGNAENAVSEAVHAYIHAYM